MRKIDKNKILSKDYKKWLEKLGDNDHPKYNSSKGDYYPDIKMSLLYCQNSLCAYTEKLLCDPEYVSIDYWDDQGYTRELVKFDKNAIKGDLEHFDESLKKKKAWLWDNLFIVDTHANCRIKGTKPIKYILKPDTENYNPYKYLAFDFKAGVFIPNISLSTRVKEEVSYMIDTLGINCYYFERKKQLENYKLKNELGLDVNPHEYITSWNMTLQNL